MTSKPKQTTKPAAPAAQDGEVIAPPKNALQTVATPKLDAFMKQVIPPGSAKAIWGSLPEHISRELFQRNLYNALAANPKLMTYNPALIFREVSKAAALGLLLDPLLGEAYMIEAYNYKTSQKEPQLRVGYKGMIKLARQSGKVANLWAHDVREHDTVEADLGFPKRYTHKPVLFGDRGDVIGYTAVITFKDGTFDFEPMSKADVLAIRDRSDAWKAYQKGDIKSTPWATDEIEMSKKTVIRRLMKRQDQSPEMRDAQRIEDEAEPIAEITARALPPEIPADDADAKNSRDRSTERSAEAKTTAKPRGTRAAEQAKAKEPEPEPPQPETSDDDEGAPPPPPDDEASGEMPVPPKGAPSEVVLKWVDDTLGEITNDLLDAYPDLLAETWETRIWPRMIDAFPPDKDEAQALYRKHERRLEQ